MKTLSIFLSLILGFSSAALADMTNDFTTVSQASSSLATFCKELRAEKNRKALFACIYSLTVAQTEKNLNRGDFEDAAWVRTLVVNYANVYRRTVMADLNGQRAVLPEGWRFEFAYAESENWNADLDLVYGINVHIARDLVEGLYLTRTDYKSDLKKRDFMRISDSLKEAMPAIWKVFKSYGSESRVPSVIRRDAAMEWITYLRGMAWDRAVNTHEYDAAGKKEFLDKVDAWLVREQKRYGTRYPLIRY